MDALDLAGYRAAVARIYLDDTDLAGWRAARDELFRDHPQSPIPRGTDFDGLRYFPPNEGAIVEAFIIND